MGRYRFSPEAAQDLDNIWDYVFDLSESVRRADRVIDDVRTVVELIADSPGIGVTAPEFGLSVRVYNKRGYVIAYRERRDHVEIICLTGGADDLKRRFESS